MGKPKVQILEAAGMEGGDGLAQDTAVGGYKVFNRIIDWITNDRMQLLNITDRINEIVRKSGVRDGLVHLQSLHTTSAVFINEWQDALVHDVKGFFEQVVLREQYYRHNDPATFRLRAKECRLALARNVDGPDPVPASSQRNCAPGHLAEHNLRGVRWTQKPVPRRPGFWCIDLFHSDRMPRFFTLQQAEKLLPQVETAIRDAISLKSEYQQAEAEWETFRAG